MLKKFMNHMHHNQKGITGLETAIILIAFVVVAAVFAFTALSAGLFSTEKSKEAVYSGLKEAQSTLELKGSVTTNAVNAIDTMDGLITTWTTVDGGVDGKFTVTRDTGTKKEGAASLKIPCTATSQNDYAYKALPTQSFLSTDTISLWIYSSVALAAGDLKFGAATTTDITAGAVNVPAVTVPSTWTYLTFNPPVVTDAVYYGFEYTKTTVLNIFVDMVQGPLPVSDRTNMPVTYVDSIEFTVVNSLGGEQIDFALPTDTNNDGVINSSDAAKTNYLTISYDDAYQQVSDLAWTVTRIVGDADYLLEQNEIFKVTVDLKAVNLATTGDGKIGANHTFNLEVKPVTGAVLVINKTTPQILHPVDDLN